MLEKVYWQTASDSFLKCWKMRIGMSLFIQANIQASLFTQTHAMIDLRETIKTVRDDFWQLLPLIKSLRTCFPHASKHRDRNYQSHSTLHFSLSFSFSDLSAPVSPVGTTIQEWKIACTTAWIFARLLTHMSSLGVKSDNSCRGCVNETLNCISWALRYMQMHFVVLFFKWHS